MSIGKRVVEIVLKATDDTTGAFSGLTKKIADLTKEFPALGVLAGLGFGKIVEWAGKAAQAVQQAIDANVKLGASFDDMSQRTEIAAETLTRWDYIAKLNGATIGDFETALRKLRQTMAEAMNGGQGAIDVFARLGVEFQTTDGKMRDLETVMLDIGEVINRFGVESVQGAAAQDALGRASATVVAILKQGRESLSMWGREADAYTSKMTEGWVEAAAAIDDASERAKALRENIIAGFNAEFSLSKWWNEHWTGVMMQIFDLDAWDKIQDLNRDKARAAGLATATAYVDGLLGNMQVDVSGAAMKALPLALQQAASDLNVPITETVFDTDSAQFINVLKTSEKLASDLKAASEKAIQDSSALMEKAKLPAPKIEKMTDVLDLDIASRFGEAEDEANMLLDDLLAMEAIASGMDEGGLPPLMDPEVIARGDEALRNLIESANDLRASNEAVIGAFDDMVSGIGSVASQSLSAFASGTDGAIMFGRAIRSTVISALSEMIVKLTVIKGLTKLFSFFGFESGGQIPQRAAGGRIPGAANGYAIPDGPRGMDSVLIAGMPGEEVINRNLSRRLDRMVTAYEYGAAVSPFAISGGGRGGGAVIQFNVARPVSVLDGLAYGETAVIASRKYQEANL